MSVLVSRTTRPELFSTDERPLSDIINAVELVYAEIGTKHEYNQQELIKACKDAGISNYDINLALSVLIQTKRIMIITG